MPEETGKRESEASAVKVPENGDKVEGGLLRLAWWVITLCLCILGLSPFAARFGGDSATMQQVIPAVIMVLTAVIGWAFGSSMGSLRKQGGIQQVIDKATK